MAEAKTARTDTDAPSDASATKGTVEVTLSQHWAHDGKDYVPTDKVRVPRAVASGLISAGYTTVNPRDREAVRKALK